MATSPVNNIKKSVAPKSLYAYGKNFIDATVSFNQGDLLALVAGKFKAIALDGDTATVAGVAKVTVSSGKLASPYVTAVDASQAIQEIPGPEFGDIVELKLNVGDAFNPGDLVYPIGSVDAQTISSSSNAGARKACGIYQGPVVAAAVAGDKGLVSLGAQLNGNLIF